MAKPVVVIVGRPNVGKSSLFNRMTGTRAAIVEDLPGVTKDRNYIDASWEGKTFLLVDTGGFYLDPPEDVFLQAKEQAFFAIEEGDIIIHLLDGKDGLNPADLELARLLRMSGKKVVWAVNKIDASTREDRLYDFYRIGTDQLLPLSAVTGYGYEEFMDKLKAFLPDYREQKVDYPRVAVVGRPNVGKSTLVNALIGKQRMVVSSKPGTTVDSIDSVCTYHGRKYLVIDTAGLRRKGKIEYSIERFSMVRAVRSIARSDLALIILDASEGITDQDQKIAGIAKEYGKGSIFLLNKWDLVKDPDPTYEALMSELSRKMWFSTYSPVITISGISKKRITKVFPVIDKIRAERKKRIQTSDLNRFFRDSVSRLSLPLYRGRAVKLFYMTQVEGDCPVFVIFVNYKKAVKKQHLSFIEKELREHFGFEGTPVKIYVRERRREKR